MEVILSCCAGPGMAPCRVRASMPTVHEMKIYKPANGRGTVMADMICDTIDVLPNRRAADDLFGNYSYSSWQKVIGPRQKLMVRL